MDTLIPMDTAQITIALGTIVVFGVGAQWLGRKTGIPSIVLLLLAGILAGPVTGLVDPDELLGATLDPAVTLAVGLLLFDSGFALRFRDFTEGRSVAYTLVSVGMLITWAVGSVASYFIFDLSLAVAALLGAVLVVSGPTVVGPILKMARPSRTTGKILEWEGTMLDPIGATLGIVVLTAITTTSEHPLLGAIGLTLATALVGIAIGVACAVLLVLAIRYFAMPDDLEVPVAFMFAVLAFSAANVLFSEAGLFATLTLGLVLANQKYAYVARIERFQASIGTLVIATLFIVLAATIDLAALTEVLLPSALLLAVLVLVARPLAVFLSTLRSGLEPRSRGFIASVAPRGIVAASTVSFYAITLADNDIAANQIVPITFAIIIGAGIVYGFGSPAMSRILGVSQGTPKGVALVMPVRDAHPVAAALTEAGVPVLVSDNDVSDVGASEHRGYEIIGAEFDDEAMAAKLEDIGIGTAVIGTGLGERDLLAMTLIGSDLGMRNVYYLPRHAQGHGSGVDERWRAQTPASHIAFGPTMTRGKLVELIHGGADLQWYSADADLSELPTGTTPLFIVTSQGRAVIANQASIGKARGTAGERVLCLHPTAP